MKKLQLSFLAAAMFMFMSADAQYVRLGFGYHGNSVSTSSGSTMTLTATSSTQTAVNLSSGKGIPVTGAFGMDIMDNVGFEFGLNFLMGSNQTAIDADLQVLNSSTVVTTQSSQLRVTPSLVLHTDNDGMNMYSRFGVIVPVSGTTTLTREETTALGTTTTEMESSGNPSLGWTGAFGVSFSAGSALNIFAEVEGINLAIGNKSREVVSIDGPAGTPTLDQLPASVKTTNFHDELTEASNVEGTANFDPTKASDELTSKSSFSSFGFNLGIIWVIGG